MRNDFILSPFFLGESLPGLAEEVQESWKLNDPGIDGASSAEIREAVHEGIAESARAAFERGDRPVSLAGDCCTALAMLAGMRRAGIEPSLLWFDAHGDFNTPESSPSGFLGGMPLAMLVGRGDDSVRRALDLEPLAEDRVILSDARDLDPIERRELEASRVTRRQRLDELLEHPWPMGPLWVHFDADVVEPSESPSHRYPARGGPSSSEVRRVFHSIAATGRLAAVSVSSWDPALDLEGTSRDVTLSLLDTLVG